MLMQQMQNPNASQNPLPNTVSLNHGGHEMFDMHEVLSGTINVLDQFMMFRQYIQDPELCNILDRQYQHILAGYNALVETFTTGQAPAKPASYQMTQTSGVVYGLQPSQPKKPNMSLADVQDKGISGHMLGLIKSAASLLTMTSVEVTNLATRRLMAGMVPSYVEMAYEIFLYQNKHAYYQVPQLMQSDMQQMLSAYVPMTTQPTMPQSTMPQ